MALKPLAIAEITKAYQNDPRTKLAQAVMETGTSTAPVAQGKYAYADGIARALQGALGGYITKKTNEKYGAEQETVRAARQAEGELLKASLTAPPPPLPSQAPAPAQSPPQASQIAAALGTPAPVTPAAPAQPSGPLSGPPQVGVGQLRQPPFGNASPPSGGAPSAPAVPGVEAVPEGPAAVARPVAPEAQGPTRSRTLEAAARLMAGGNVFESDRAQDLYSQGMTEQTKLDETATERRQRLADMGYESDLSGYREGQSQDRSNAYADRRGAQERNFSREIKASDQAFTAGENNKDRAQRTWETKFDAGTRMSMMRASQAFESVQQDKLFQQQLRLKGLDDKGAAAATAQAARQKYFGTKDGQKFLQTSQDAVDSAASTITTLNEFESRLNKTKKVGGVLLSNAPGSVRWANSDYQVLESLTNQLTMNNAKDLKGSISDKDVVLLKSLVPSIRNNRGATKDQLRILRNAATRKQQYAIARAENVASGSEIQFMRNWSAYTNANSIQTNVSYDQWLKSRPKYDANGNEVK